MDGNDYRAELSSICHSLEESGKGLLNLYSAGDFDCYAVVPRETVRRMNELFRPLFDNYM